MPISVLDLTTALVLKMKAGVDENEHPVYKTMTIRKVKITAADQDIYEVAQGIATVLRYEVQDVIKSQTRQLVSA